MKDSPRMKLEMLARLKALRRSKQPKPSDLPEDQRVERTEGYHTDDSQRIPEITDTETSKVQSDDVADPVYKPDSVTNDPLIGSNAPWTKREMEYLSMSRCDLILMHADGEILPPRILARIFKFDRIRRCSDLFYLFHR